MNNPVICFGQQPCGFFPKRFLYAKILTALKLQSEIGGTIVFFFHDSDHDLRETQTLLKNKVTQVQKTFNFTSANKIQKKWTPLYSKRVDPLWILNTARQLPAYVNHEATDLFKTSSASDVATFCLNIYERMGLLKGISVKRSSDPEFRAKACQIEDYYVDVPYLGETVRARKTGDKLLLHEGGTSYMTLDSVPVTKTMVSPTRDSRLIWMQSVIHCTHYIAGLGERAYLNTSQAPEITFIDRDLIERQNEAHALITH